MSEEITFFEQTDLEQYIIDYLGAISNANDRQKQPILNSENILKSLESQSGLLVEQAKNIYSFSHLAFQEYLTARIFAADEPSCVSQSSLQELVSHITEARWQEIFLLVAEMLPKADPLFQLMKEQIDNLLTSDRDLQAFLIWLNLKSQTVETEYRSATVKSFYLDIELGQIFDRIGSNFHLTLATEPNFHSTLGLNFDLVLDLSLDRLLGLLNNLEFVRSPALTFHRVIDRCLTNSLDLEPELAQLLCYLKKQLPEPNASQVNFDLWWQKRGQAWSENIRAIAIEYRQLGYYWQFSHQQKQLLKQYYQANQLLLNCLNNSCSLSIEVDRDIQQTLLIPTTLKKDKLVAVSEYSFYQAV